MKPTDPFHGIDEADLMRQAQRLRAEHVSGWLRGLRRRMSGQHSG